MIVAENVTKRYGRVCALDDVSFVIQPGESVALWGANGAGKTTALRCLLGIHKFEGHLTVHGLDVRQAGKQARTMIGYVPQEAVFHDLSVIDTLYFYARLKKAPIENIARTLNQVQLEAHDRKSVKALSGGMKQRLALAVALLSDPPILVLDEPTANLDLQAQRDFLRLIQTLNYSGKTVVFSSHRLDEVAALARRVLVLSEGKLTVTCSPDGLSRKLDIFQWLRIKVLPPQREGAIQILEERGFTYIPNGQTLFVRIPAGDKMSPLRTLEQSDIPVQDFELIENGDTIQVQGGHHG